MTPPCSSVVTTCISQSLRIIDLFIALQAFSHTLVCLCYQRFSFLVPSIIIWWTWHLHIITSEHNLSKRPQNTMQSLKLLFTEKPREKRREKKKLLDDGGFAFGRVLANSTRCFVAFFFLLGFSAKRSLLPYQIANILEEKGEGKITTFVLFFLSIFFVFFSLIFLHTQSPRGLQIKHKKQMCFSNTKKRFFLRKVFLFLVKL
jgi:hypothetical protein